MLHDVVLMRKNGERLTKENRPSYLRGTIRIVEMDRQHNHFKRNILMIHLWLSHGDSRMRALANMADPVLLPYDGPGLLIAGIETEASGNTIKEHRQVWLCTKARGTEVEWEREEAAREKAKAAIVVSRAPF